MGKTYKANDENSSFRAKRGQKRPDKKFIGRGGGDGKFDYRAHAGKTTFYRNPLDQTWR